MDAANTVVLSFFSYYILVSGPLFFFILYFSCTFEQIYGIYIIAKQGYAVPKCAFGAITKKRILCLGPSQVASFVIQRG